MKNAELNNAKAKHSRIDRAQPAGSDPAAGGASGPGGRGTALGWSLAVLLLAVLSFVGADVDAQRDARPLPAFTGTTLTGETLSVADLIGKRLLIFTFDATNRDAKAAARAVFEIAKLRGEHNFEILGAARGGSAIYEMGDRSAFDFRVLLDNEAGFAGILGATGGAAFFLVNAEGNLVRGSGVTVRGQNESEAAERMEGMLRDWLRLPTEDAFGDSSFGGKPEAPDFTTTTLDGDRTFTLSEAKGRGVLLVFFLHTCPHCHDALAFYKAELDKLPEDKRPHLVGISARGSLDAVTQSLKKYDIDFFDPYSDPSGSIQRSYGGLSGFPTTFLIDREGRIVTREEGWSRRRHPPLLRMRLAQVSGVRVPMLLNTKGYSGNEFCQTCHEGQHDTWALTTHADAFETLVQHGAENDPECVGCHVVGWEQKGGYSLDRPSPHLEDVGCESCHGRGGPHISKSFVTDDNYEPVCVTCHDPKHSLGFDYTSFVAKVSHAANAQFAGLSDEEKRKLLEERKKVRDALLPTEADYVGSEACQSCHAAEYETWSKHDHARAGQTLVADGKEGDTACLSCHTTGYAKPGGFPEAGPLANHSDLGRVGCESCHGPGGAHIGEDDPKRGSILALADKCDSCVILQVCGGCHDDANDPGFEFEVQEKIDLQRHGAAPPSASLNWRSLEKPQALSHLPSEMSPHGSPAD